MPVCSRCKHDLPQDKFAKNKSKKSGFNTYCKQCMASYAKANKDRFAERMAAYQAENAEHLAEVKKDWRLRNQEKVRTLAKEHYEVNKSDYVERAANWKKANPDKVKASTSAHYRKKKAYYHAAVYERRAAEIKASTPWADTEAVSEYYRAAVTLNKYFGAGYFEVDHIVPLRSKLVCGLHTEANLQLLPRKQNRTKGNRSWPNMP